MGPDVFFFSTSSLKTHQQEKGRPSLCRRPPPLIVSDGRLRRERAKPSNRALSIRMRGLLKDRKFQRSRGNVIGFDGLKFIAVRPRANESVQYGDVDIETRFDKLDKLAIVFTRRDNPMGDRKLRFSITGQPALGLRGLPSFLPLPNPARDAAVVT